MAIENMTERKEVKMKGKLYATSLDENDLPIVTELNGSFVAEGFKFNESCKLPENTLPAYESWNTCFSIRDKRIIPFRSISDCYSRGRYFINYNFARLRMHMFFKKQLDKNEKETEYFAGVFARLDKLKTKG